MKPSLETGLASHSSISCVFTQMSAQQGIKKHSEKAVTAIYKELKQLNDGAMDKGRQLSHPSPLKISLNRTRDKGQALEAVNLIKEKRCGKLKEPRSKGGVFCSLSTIHSSKVPQVLNLTTGSITTQFHVVFVDLFPTVSSVERKEDPLSHSIVRYQNENS